MEIVQFLKAKVKQWEKIKKLQKFKKNREIRKSLRSKKYNWNSLKNSGTQIHVSKSK